jgi:mRNA-degrading endonuclease RelE of RelBE toxin-antitoxin system
MDKVRKNLLKFSSDERDRALLIIQMIEASDFSGLHLKKLSGTEFLFRVRSGRVRIVFRKRKDFNEIVYVGYRSERTYRDF